MNTKVKFGQWDCRLEIKEFASVLEGKRRAKCLLLVDDDEAGGVVCKASLNILDVHTPSGHTWIKNWGENDGVLRALEVAGVIKPTGDVTVCGHEFAYLAEILIDIPTPDYD